MLQGVNYFAVLAFFFFALQYAMLGQQATHTNCTPNGNTADCTSTTTGSSDAGVWKAHKAQQQGYFLNGSAVDGKIGKALGQGLRGKVRKFCAKHPGEVWVLRNSKHVLLLTGECW